MRTTIKLAAGAAGLALAATLAACGGGGSTITLRGQVTPNGPASALGLGGDAQTYAQCANDTPAPGTQVVIHDPSGKVIGTAALGQWSHATIKASGLTLYPCALPFTITGVPAETRYGFSINNVPGTIWENSAQFVTLTVSGS